MYSGGRYNCKLSRKYRMKSFLDENFPKSSLGRMVRFLEPGTIANEPSTIYNIFENNNVAFETINQQLMLFNESLN